MSYLKKRVDIKEISVFLLFVIVLLGFLFIIMYSDFTGNIVDDISFLEEVTPKDNSIKNSESITVSVSTGISEDSSVFLNWQDTLKSWWTFNSEDSVDEINGYSFLNHNSIFQENCKKAGCFSFPMTDSYIDLGNNDFGIKDSNKFTISLWFNPSSEGIMIQKGDYIYPFHISLNGVLIRSGIRTVSGGKYLWSKTRITYGQWNNVILTYDGSKAILYLNGQKEVSEDLQGVLSFNSDSVCLGGQCKDSSLGFNGSIDDVMIFNRDIGEDEVKSIYNANLYSYEHFFQNLYEGDYFFKAYASDSDGNVYSTNLRKVTLNKSYIDNSGLFNESLDSNEIIVPETNLTLSSDCKLTSAHWDKTNVIFGDNVSLIVYGENCQGVKLVYSLYEEDSFDEGNISEIIFENFYTSNFIGNLSKAVWKSQFHNDCNGTCLPSEYFFIANVINDSNNFIKSSNRLGVLKKGEDINQTDFCSDFDKDGFSSDFGCGKVDCNDANSLIYPNAEEKCNGVDDNCDGIIDEGCGNSFECKINKVYWSEEKVYPGVPIDLIIESENCQNQQFTINIYEDDLFFDSQIQTSQANNVSLKWKSFYVDDFFTDPEYYFQVVLENGEKFDSPLLDMEKVPKDLLPKKDNFDGSTTEFDKKGVNNISDVTLEKKGKGKIEFSKEVNVQGLDLDSDILIDKNFISLNSEKIPELNTSAKLTLYDLDFENPVILENGIPCKHCQIIQYSKGNLEFNVEHFSNYSAIESSNIHYVRESATGNNDGSDWENAYTQLPSVLQRGHTYFIADGTYPGYTFDDPEQGEEYINIVKAIQEDHGTDIGWSDSYGDGQAVFSCSGGYGCINIYTSYVNIDGQKRESIDSGHGFKIENTYEDYKAYAIYVRSNRVPLRSFKFKYIEMIGPRTEQQNSAVILMGDPTNTIQDVYIGFNYILGYKQGPLGGVYTRDLDFENNFYIGSSERVSLHGGGIIFNYLYEDSQLSFWDNIILFGSGTSIVEPKNLAPGEDYIGNLYFWNNIVADSSQSNGVFGTTATYSVIRNWYVYNNVISNCYTGQYALGGTAPTSNSRAYNNIFVGFANNIWNGWEHDYNYFDDDNHGESNAQIGENSPFVNVYDCTCTLIGDSVLPSNLEKSFNHVYVDRDSCPSTRCIFNIGDNIVLRKNDNLMRKINSYESVEGSNGIIYYMIGFSPSLSIIPQGGDIENWRNKTNPNLDFRLKEQINPGVDICDIEDCNSYPFNVDADGNLRGEDGLWDRGAYEYQDLNQEPLPECSVDSECPDNECYEPRCINNICSQVLVNEGENDESCLSPSFCNGAGVCVESSINNSIESSNIHYVRESATGNNDGSDWENAYTQLPSVLQRGHTYFIADGTYPGYTFDDPEQGEEYINIVKAIQEDHGTDIGWSDSYGDGQAVFSTTTGGINWQSSGIYHIIGFETGYYNFDGKTGGGPKKWDSDYGFKLDFNNNCLRKSKGISIWNGVDFIQISHIDIGFCGQGIYDMQTDGVYIVDSNDEGSSNIKISYNYLHDLSRVGMILNYLTDSILEYNYLANIEGSSAENSHGSGIAMNYCGNDELRNYVKPSNISVRYNYFDNVFGTAMIEPKGGTHQSHFYIYGNIINNCTSSNGEIGSLTSDVITDSEVNHNIISNSRSVSYGNGILFFGGVNNTAYNNLFYNNPNIRFMNVEHDYNWFYPAPSSSYLEENWQIGSGNPFFNTVNKDFSLIKSTGRGIELSFRYNLDILGNLRGEDGVWDRGAYEYQDLNQEPLPECSVDSECPDNECYEPRCINNICSQVLVNEGENDESCLSPSFCNGAGVCLINPGEDSDNDGILDEEDNCIFISNSVQSDLDNDGVGDACDYCARTNEFSYLSVNKYGCAAPVYSNFVNEISTNLSSLANISGVSNLILGIPLKARIIFDGHIFDLEGADLDSNVFIEDKEVIVNTSNLLEFNCSAIIHFLNITYISPKVLLDGEECDSCLELGYINSTYSVEVPHFSKYNVVEGYVQPTSSISPVIGSGSSGGGGGGSSITKSCVSNWGCSEWSNCLNGEKTRICNDINNCESDVDKPLEVNYCSSEEKWSCSNWGECFNGKQIRTCVDINALGTENNKPKTEKDCIDLGVVEISKEIPLSLKVIIILTLIFIFIVIYFLVRKLKTKSHHKFH